MISDQDIADRIKESGLTAKWAGITLALRHGCISVVVVRDDGDCGVFDYMPTPGETLAGIFPEVVQP